MARNSIVPPLQSRVYTYLVTRLRSSWNFESSCAQISRELTRSWHVHVSSVSSNLIEFFKSITIYNLLQRITKFTILNVRQIKKCSVHPLLYHRAIRQFLWDINLIEFIILLSITAFVLRGQHKAEKEDEKHAGEYAGRDDCPRNVISRKREA